MENEITKTDIMQDVDTCEKTDLCNPNVSDSTIVAFSTLDLSSKPLRELPLIQKDYTYPQYFEPRCNLCKSAWKDIAEHVYLTNGRKPNAVVTFFAEYFNAKITWICVDHHMKNHCDLKKISTSGLDYLKSRADNARIWEYREMDLAIIGVLAEIDELRGLNLEGRPETMLKRSSQLQKYYKDLMDYGERRDAIASECVSIFTVLKELYDEMLFPADKDIIINKVKKLKEALSAAGEE